MQHVILSLHALSHDDKVLAVEQSLKKKSYESPWFFAWVKTYQFLFILAKNICDSWFVFLTYHSTSKTFSSWDGACSNEILLVWREYARDCSYTKVPRPMTSGRWTWSSWMQMCTREEAHKSQIKSKQKLDSFLHPVMAKIQGIIVVLLKSLKS